MPAILRIFPYQTDASLSVLGHIGSYDQGEVGSGRTPPCNIMPFAPSTTLSQLDSVGVMRLNLKRWPLPILSLMSSFQIPVADVLGIAE